jgi:uncharacterized membrane protein YccF (DUF307 family)
MPASPQAHVSQAKVGRIVGFSLAGLWLAVSMLAAVASAVEATDTATITSVSKVTANVVPASN